MKRLPFLSIDAIQGFIVAVLGDGGFFVARSHTARVFRDTRGADLICSMSAGDTNKLYFEKHEP